MGLYELLLQYYIVLGTLITDLVMFGPIFMLVLTEIKKNIYNIMERFIT